MKKRAVIVIALVLIILISAFVFYENRFGKMTGETVSNFDDESPTHNIGPSASEQACMMQCMGCTSPGVGCTGNSEVCLQQCNAQKPESTEETSCMEECVLVGCGEFDFVCQTENKDECEEECNMSGDRPDESEMSAEQICITNCVAEKDPNLRCGASQEGETGNTICQECATSCVHLYEGPCLDDTKLKAKQKECETCEHCYGKPLMGDSGEGWECVVDVKCSDASSEFGDEPGEGPGVGQEGFVAKVGNIFEAIGNFFKGLFGK